MKPIQESFKNTIGISNMINEDRMDEGFMDVLKWAKDKFESAWKYMKGSVAKIGSYILPLDETGHVMPAITPLTAGQAYKDGLINKSNTCIILGSEASNIVKLKSNIEAAKELYGKGDSRSYWLEGLKYGVSESIDDENENINEVRLANQDPEAVHNVIVDDEELKAEIRHAIENSHLARLLIWGAPGIGKTAILSCIVDEVSKKLNTDYQLIVKTLSNETPDNFTLPKYVDMVNDDDFAELQQTLEKEKKKESSYIRKLLKKVNLYKATDIPKTWLPVYKPTGDKELDKILDEKCGKGLLFIDELSRATKQVLNVCLPLINEGKFNDYKIGSGWTIICASNRFDDDSGQEEIGTAMSNRFGHIYYEPTVHTWRKWADNQNYISPLLLQWLSMPESENMSGGKFFYMDPNEDRDDGMVTKLICTPRSWEMAMRSLATYSRTGTLEGFTIFDIDQRILKRTLNQYVPACAVESFVAFLNVVRKIGNFDAAVHDIWNNGGSSFKVDKKDLNLIMLPLSQLIICAHNRDLPTAKEFENLTSWVVKQNSDQLASYIVDVFNEVFLGPVSNEKMKQNIYYYHKLKTKVAAPTAKLMDVAYKPMLDKWNISELPDWSTGMMALAKKYGKAFELATVDGKEALG